MRTIFKYPFQIQGRQQIPLPGGAVILHVGVQRQLDDGEKREVPTLWAEVDTKRMDRFRMLHICGTGHPLPDQPTRYLGTIHMADGHFVWHVFEELDG